VVRLWATPPSSPGRAVLFNRRPSPSPRATEPPASHCRRRRCTCSAARSHRRPTVPIYSLGPIEPPRVACCPPRAVASPELAPPRQPPPAAVDFPRQRAPRPNSSYAQDLGEHAHDYPPFPGQERRRSRRNPGEPATSLSQGPNCNARHSYRVFCAN
jgi:hypothetical protein